MNTENFEYLKNGLKYLGFDEKLGIELAKQIKEQPAEFSLKAQSSFGKDGGDKMDANLHFKRSTQGDMYFFNSYSASIKKDNAVREQTFYIQKNKGVTAKEAFNLLEGRSVNKDLMNREGEKYNAWIKLDFENTDQHGNYKVKQFHSNYGYDLAATLDKYPLKELGDAAQKDKLMSSLEKGNVQSVTFTKDGKEEKMFLEANPQFKSVTVYDSGMKKIREENHQQGKEVSAAGELEKKAGKNNKQAEKKDDNDLLPKNRQSKGKRQGVK